MSNSPSVTLRDVLRLRDGHISDEAEASRVERAMAAQPDLVAAALACTPVQETSRTIPAGDFFQSRLAQIMKQPEWDGPGRQEFPSSLNVPSSLNIAENGEMKSIEIELAVTYGDRIEIEFKGVPSLQDRLQSLILGQFTFPYAGQPYVNSSFALPEKWKSTPSTKVVEASEKPIAGSPRIASVQAKSAAQRREPELDTSRFYAGPTSERDQFCVRAAIPDGHDETLIAVETSDGSESTITPLLLPRADKRFAELAYSPDDLPSWLPDVGKVCVRALKNADLKWLTADQVSHLLATREEFAAVPIRRRDDGRSTAQLRYEPQLDFAMSESTTWFVRLQGGV